MAVSIPGWLASALAGGGLDVVEAWAELWQAGSRVATVDISEGAVKSSWGQDITSTVDLTVPGWDGFLPETPVVGTGRRFGDGTFGSGIYGDYRHSVYKTLAMPVKTTAKVLWKATVGANSHTITLGTFTVTSVEWADTADGPTMRLSGSDVSWRLDRGKWLTPTQVAAGTGAATAIGDLADAAVPGISVSVPSVSYTTPLLTYLPGDGKSVWRACADVADAAGLELCANRDGGLTGVPREDDDEATPIWTVADTGTAVQFTETPNGDDLCNTVLAFGESSGDTPVYGFAQDTAGPFGTAAVGGPVVREYRSPLIRSGADATNAANSLLRKWSAVSEVVEVSTAPVPHLDPGDYVRIVSGGLELDDVFRVVSVSAPLNPTAAWQLTVRRRVA